MTDWYGAKYVLLTFYKKKKLVLEETMVHIINVLTNTESNEYEKEEALQMFGTVAEVLARKESNRKRAREILSTYVFSEFFSSCYHLRGRACWVLRRFSGISRFKQIVDFRRATELVVNLLLDDRENISVKLEAALTLETFLGYEEKVERLIASQIEEIMVELWSMHMKTRVPHLVYIMKKIFNKFYETLMLIAGNICNYTADLFNSVMESNIVASAKMKSVTPYLYMVHMFLSRLVKTNNTEMVAQLEPVVYIIVSKIFSEQLSQFYDTALPLVELLTAKKISPEMWHTFDLLYKIFKRSRARKMELFKSMTPTIHNYIMADTPTFLSNPNHILATYNMCKVVMSGYREDENLEVEAARLLEVIILQCKGKIDQCVPFFVELVLQRITREISTTELRVMCLLVLIAALHYNDQLFFEILEEVPPNRSMNYDDDDDDNNAVNMDDDDTVEPIINILIEHWVNNVEFFLGIHDRKLCVLGLCQLMSMTENRPSVLNRLAYRLIPSVSSLLDGLRTAYSVKAYMDNLKNEPSDNEEDSLSDEDDSNESVDSFSSDEDNKCYLEYWKYLRVKKFPSSIYEIRKEDGGILDKKDVQAILWWEYNTPIDDDSRSGINEWTVFKEVMTNIQTTDPVWHQQLVADLTSEQQKSLQILMQN